MGWSAVRSGPRRALGDDDALERHVRSLGGGADSVGVPCEKAEHDLVGAHEQRTEVADGPSLLEERVGGLFSDAFEGEEVFSFEVVDVGDGVDQGL